MYAVNVSNVYSGCAMGVVVVVDSFLDATRNQNFPFDPLSSFPPSASPSVIQIIAWRAMKRESMEDEGGQTEA